MSENNTNKLAIVMMIAHWEDKYYKLGTILKNKMVNDYSYEVVKQRLDSMTNVQAITKVGGVDE